MTPRWAIKRGLKWAVEWGMALSGCSWLYRKTSAFASGLRILTYHRIADEPTDSFTVSKKHFQYHMAFLSDHFEVVDLSDLVLALSSGRMPDNRVIAVTFDDGYREVATFVREVLDHYRIKATFFVVTGILDGSMKPLNGPFLTWDDVRELSEAGFAIGSHTVSHRSLGRLPTGQVEEELMKSRRRLQEELGDQPRGLSYPYGTLRDFSPAIAETARRVGYLYAVTAVHGLNHAHCDPFLLRRTSLTAGDGPRTFRMIMKGNLDPWVLVDRWGYRLRQM